MTYKEHLKELKDKAVDDYQRAIRRSPNSPMGKPEVEPRFLNKLREEISGTQVIYLSDGPRRMSDILDTRSLYVLRELTESMISLKGNLGGFLKNFVDFSNIPTNSSLHTLLLNREKEFHQKRDQEFGDTLLNLNNVLLELKLVEKQLQSISGMLSMQRNLANTMGSQFVGVVTKREAKELKDVVDRFGQRLSEIIIQSEDGIAPELRIKSNWRVYPKREPASGLVERPDRPYFQAAAAYMEVIPLILKLEQDAVKISEKTMEAYRGTSEERGPSWLGPSPDSFVGKERVRVNSALRTIRYRAMEQLGIDKTKLGLNIEDVIKSMDEIRNNIRVQLAA